LNHHFLLSPAKHVDNDDGQASPNYTTRHGLAIGALCRDTFRKPSVPSATRGNAKKLGRLMGVPINPSEMRSHDGMAGLVGLGTRNQFPLQKTDARTQL
jgi:hypothetical protein